MKRFLLAAALVAATLSAPAHASDVGVSVSIGQPGFYGRLDIGGFPPPALIYPQPVMIQRVPAGRPPMYLRVPPGHARHWGQYCRQYGACGERVYFVRDDWYEREYVPRYQERHDSGRGGWRDERRDDRRGYDERRGEFRGEGHEHGRGHGHGRGRD